MHSVHLFGKPTAIYPFVIHANTQSNTLGKHIVTSHAQEPKQLRQILGTLKFHHRIIVNYKHYVAPPLSLMKNGTKWRWTAELQEDFANL
jgi:hypothetical protein